MFSNYTADDHSLEAKVRANIVRHIGDTQYVYICSSAWRDEYLAEILEGDDSDELYVNCEHCCVTNTDNLHEIICRVLAKHADYCFADVGESHGDADEQWDYWESQDMTVAEVGDGIETLLQHFLPLWVDDVYKMPATDWGLVSDFVAETQKTSRDRLHKILCNYLSCRWDHSKLSIEDALKIPSAVGYVKKYLPEIDG